MKSTQLTSGLAGGKGWLDPQSMKLRGGLSLRLLEANEFHICRWMGLDSMFSPVRPTRARGLLRSSLGKSKSQLILIAPAKIKNNLSNF